MFGSRRRRIRALASGWAPLLAIAGSLAHAQAPAKSTAPTARVAGAPAFTGAQRTAPPSAVWVTNGGTLYNQRYSPLALINRDNVKGLKPTWRVGLNGSGSASKYSGQAQPLVFRGVIYIVTGADDVFAVDVDGGKLLWSYEAKLDDTIDTVCCGWESRG